MEYSVMRTELEQQNISDGEVAEIIAAVNELELASLKKPMGTSESKMALIIGAVLVISGVFLWFWIRSKEMATAWQLLAAVPILGAIGLYLISKSNAEKRNRVGAHTRFQ